MTIQHALRRHLKRARLALKMKQDEFNFLLNKNRRHSTMASVSRMNDLESDLNIQLEETTKIAVLLRPNCRFSIIWRSVIMIFVTFEILTKYFDYRHAGEKETMTGIAYTSQRALQKHLVPVPVSELDVCSLQKSMRFHDLPSWISRIRFLKAILEKSSGFFKRSMSPVKETEEFPWFCQGAFSRIQSIYIQVLCFLIEKAIVVTGVISIIDIFVTFFTGSLDENGTLVPSPFIQRWILNFAVKLLTNPLTGSMTIAIFRLIHEAGPDRIFRWCVAFINPLLQSLLWKVWMIFARTR
eukprot:CAMPEP_0197236502 /NCGR_PEP_ID=MMETSP1429-20130617/3578_1 /TAXON_ID=49237 /ORGANISM="Chaetoceros  sp., Strain UNC1202" /LENGTH=296 /DNA_ID=CAMNT_0042695291 /DNA_START=41 /DNA_END=931 /DNA_ORIENTATION=-